MLVSSLGMVISYGVFKVNDVSLQTSKIVTSDLDVQDLRTTVGKALGNKESCLHNLKKTTTSTPKDSIVALQTTGGVRLIGQAYQLSLFVVISQVAIHG